MTKATDSLKGTGDVEITPEMIEAGTKALWETSLVEDPHPSHALDVKLIVESALRASKAHQ